MRVITYCAKCGGTNLDYMGQDRWYCKDCEQEVQTRDRFVENPYERTRRAVYATGNKWAIENFHATHG